MTNTTETIPKPAEALMATEPASQPTALAVEPARFPAIPAYRPPKRESHRLLPSCEDAEKGLLSLMLSDASRTGAICLERKLQAENLHSPVHRDIYRLLIGAWVAGTAHDLITLTDAMSESGHLHNVGGAYYLTDIATTSIMPSMIGAYIDLIIRDSARREILRICAQTTERANDDTEDAQDVLTDMQSQVAALTIEPPTKRETFKEILIKTLDDIESGDRRKADVQSGIDSLDAVVRMQRGNMIVIAGEAKSGKTALAVTVMIHALLQQGLRCAMISLEMTAEEITQRMISSIGRQNLLVVATPPTEDQLLRIGRASSALISCLGRVELVTDVYELHPILAACRSMHKEKPLDLIILDYIQLIDASGQRKSETRQEAVAQVSRSAKRLAAELNCVVIGLSQLNDDGKLRESRAIGQDANAIIAVEPQKDGGRIIRVIAQRSGASGVECAVDWIPSTTTFQTSYDR
jgi:replicative DNA helicase